MYIMAGNILYKFTATQFLVTTARSSNVTQFQGDLRFLTFLPITIFQVFYNTSFLFFKRSLHKTKERVELISMLYCLSSVECKENTKL